MCIMGLLKCQRYKYIAYYFIVSFNRMQSEEIINISGV